VSGGLTPRGEETLVRLASWMPFEQARELLQDLVGIQVSKATVRRATLTTGEAQLSVCEGEMERLKQEVPQAPGGADQQLWSRRWSDGALGGGRVGGSQDTRDGAGHPQQARGGLYFEEVRLDFEATNHSTLGLIPTVQRRCPGSSGEWLYYGATVQDIADTWTAMVLQRVRGIVGRELKEIEANLSHLAAEHRDTVMAGRTHGQIGLPITFGFKAAIWTMEVRRHRVRLAEIAPRLDVGQLAGGVGSLSSLGPRALELQRSFLVRLGLNVPAISWTTARDTLAEWFNLLALIASTGDKIGHESYNLQRPEIDEVSEGFVTGTVGSITMPHKRNPEISEHLGTLARVIRHNASLIAESLVHDHERDGRSWKTEWVVLAETCLAAGKLLALLRTVTGNLVIHTDRMQANLDATRALYSLRP
jgi:adenylosuccinate lyase